MHYSKQAISIDQQIEVLKKRGLLITDDVQVKQTLNVVSYFRLADYWRHMEADRLTHQFKSSSHFQSVLDCYYFDKELKVLLFAAVQTIEIAIRTKMKNVFTPAFGAFWFADGSLAVNQSYFTTNLEHIRTEVNRSREEYIKGHFNKYSSPEFPPAWKTLEVVSFGTLSKLYSNFSDATVKHQVAHEFGLNHHKFLRSWMESLAILRNYCAHHSRVWNRTFPVKPQTPHKMPNKWITDFSFSPESAYSQLCCICYWLNSIYPNNTFASDLHSLFQKYSSINPSLLGFPANWKSESLWK